MHITLYHDALIPPRRYGGTERIIYWLAKALVQLGHRVTLIARKGSQIPGVESIILDKKKNKGGWWEDYIPNDTDILHLWGTPTLIPRRPFLVTIEGNGKVGERFHVNTVFVSKNHAKNHGSDIFVYNGIDPTDYSFSLNRTETLVFLAKASWKTKNLEGAIEVARKARMNLEVIGSKNWPFGLHRIFPRRNRVRFHGMLRDYQKNTILCDATALVFPVRWHEPFGIAVVEALASGCAILGTPYGSLPEIVTTEVGLLSDHASDLVSALSQTSWPFSPVECRNRVFNQFTHIQMAKQYLDLYQVILTRGSLPQKPPCSQFIKSPETLLPWYSL